MLKHIGVARVRCNPLFSPSETSLYLDNAITGIPFLTRALSFSASRFFFFFPGLTYCMIAGPEGSRIIRSFDHQYMKHSGSVEGHSRGTRASTNRTGMRQPVHIGGCWPGEAERPLLPTCRGGERLSVTHATCSGPSSLRLPSIRQAWRRTVSVSRFSCIWEAPACVH